MKKGVKCGPGCMCKNCSNPPIAVAIAPQLENSTELVEVDGEELQDSMLRDEYGEKVAGDDDQFSEHGRQ